MIESKAERPGTMSGGIQVTGAWRAALLAGVAALFVIGQTDFADAQFFRQLQHPDRRARHPSPVPEDSKARKANQDRHARSKKDVPIRHPFGENMPKGPLQLMVSINDQRAVLYSNGVRVAETQGLDRHRQPSDADRRLQHHPEEPLAPLQSLRQRADVLHAPPDLVGHRAA